MNRIDELLLMVTKYTDGQLPHGLITDIGKFIGVSRQRVEQRSKALDLLKYKKIINQKYCLFDKKPLASGRYKYCDVECRRALYAENYPKVKCHNCGNDFPVKVSTNINPRKFCRMACYSKFRRKQVLKGHSNRMLYKKTCVGCNIPFTTSRVGQKYHSHKCYTHTQNK